MSDKEAVLSRYPSAVAEHDLPNLWAVFDAPISPQGRGLWGFGNTEDDAWRDARRTIEKREGRRLTPNMK